jgi:hypothetical protein
MGLDHCRIESFFLGIHEAIQLFWLLGDFTKDGMGRGEGGTPYRPSHEYKKLKVLLH